MLLAAACLATMLGGCGADEDQGGAWETAPCWFDPLPTDATAVECGYVTRPLSGGGTAQLAVMRLHALDGLAELDPIVWVDGGPGAPTIDQRAVDIAQRWRPLLGVRRDIVIFDQRGVGRSRPLLGCAASDATIDALATDLSAADEGRQAAARIQRCADGLRADGVTLADFGVLALADDVDAVRSSLGYDRMALFGTSFGSQTVQAVMARYPDTVVAAALDAAVPLNANPWADGPTAFVENLATLFERCAETANCNNNYPDLPSTFDALLAQLDESPLTFDAEVFGRTQSVVLNTDRLVLLVRELLMRPADAAMVPRLIHETAHGDTALAALLMVRPDATPIVLGAHLSYVCSSLDGGSFVANLDDIPERMQPALAQVAAGYADACASWGVPPVDARELRRTTLDVPVIVLAGEFDPIAPPGYSDALDAQLPSAFRYTIPWAGHGSVEYTCPLRMVGSFFATPGTAPPATCLGDIAFRFDPGRDLIHDDELGFIAPLPSGWPMNRGDDFVRWADPVSRASIAVGRFEGIELPDAINAMRSAAFDRFIGQPIGELEELTIGTRTWLRESRGDTESDHLVLTATEILGVSWVVALRGPLDDINAVREYYDEAVARFGVVVSGPAVPDAVDAP